MSEEARKRNLRRQQQRQQQLTKHSHRVIKRVIKYSMYLIT